MVENCSERSRHEFLLLSKTGSKHESTIHNESLRHNGPANNRCYFNHRKLNLSVAGLCEKSAMHLILVLIGCRSYRTAQAYCHLPGADRSTTYSPCSEKLEKSFFGFSSRVSFSHFSDHHFFVFTFWRCRRSMFKDNINDHRLHLGVRERRYIKNMNF